MRLSKLLGVVVATVLLVAASVLVASFPFTNPIATDPDPATVATVVVVAGSVLLALAAASRGVTGSTAYW